RYGEYAGVGPGAHGRLMTCDGRVATIAEKHPETWAGQVEAKGHGLIDITSLSATEQGDEMLLMGLRLSEGVNLARLAALGSVRPSLQTVSELEALGLLQSISTGNAPPHAIRATPKGRFVLNAVVAKLSESFVPLEGIASGSVATSQPTSPLPQHALSTPA
ncbi:MAG: hypothetical protein CTY39_08045, partial [Hyphomicrobium sp.]